MLLILLGIMVTVFTSLSFAVKKSTLAGFAGITWLMLGAYAYFQVTWSTYLTDFYYYLALFSLLCGLPVMIIQAMETREDTEGDKTTEEDDDGFGNTEDEENVQPRTRKKSKFSLRIMRNRAIKKRQTSNIIKSAVHPK